MTITPERRREICRNAGLARAKQFTPESQRAARAAITSAECAKRGRKAFAALVAKHGIDHALDHLANHRRAHPSMLEQVVMTWLDEHYIAYEREVRIAGVHVDFLISGTRIVVEVDGKRFHTLDPLHGQDRASRDALHNMALTTHGYDVIRLDEAGIRDGSALRCLETHL